MTINNIFRTQKNTADPKPSIQQVWFEEAMKMLKARVGTTRLKKPCPVDSYKLDQSVYELLFINGLHNFDPNTVGHITKMMRLTGFMKQAFYGTLYDDVTSRLNYKNDVAQVLRMDETVFDLILNDTYVINADGPIIDESGERIVYRIRITAYEAIFKKQDVTLQDVFDLWQRFIDMPVEEASMSVMQDISDFLADVDYSKYIPEGCTLA